MLLKKIWFFMLLVYASDTLPKILQKSYIPGESSRLQLASIENGTTSLEFKIFAGGNAAAGLITPLSVFTFSTDQNKPLDIKQDSFLIICCSKGSYVPVYIQDGGPVSGKALEGYSGPYYLSMWLSYPYVTDAAKLRIRYVVKKGKLGQVGLQIGSKGDYRLVAIQDVKFLHDESIGK